MRERQGDTHTQRDRGAEKKIIERRRHLRKEEEEVGYIYNSTQDKIILPDIVLQKKC